MTGYWMYQTRWGVFTILPKKSRWVAFFEDENLGSYNKPEAALDDLVGGHTFSLPNDLDSSRMGLPDELSEWAYIGTR